MENIWSRFDKVVPMISQLEVRLLDKSLAPKNIGETLKDPQRQFCKEYLFVRYDKNKNVILLLNPIIIKYLTEGTKVLRSLIATIIKEWDCSDAW